MPEQRTKHVRSRELGLPVAGLFLWAFHDCLRAIARLPNRCTRTHVIIAHNAESVCVVNVPTSHSASKPSQISSRTPRLSAPSTTSLMPNNILGHRMQYVQRCRVVSRCVDRGRCADAPFCVRVLAAVCVPTLHCAA